MMRPLSTLDPSTSFYAIPNAQDLDVDINFDPMAPTFHTIHFRVRNGGGGAFESADVAADAQERIIRSPPYANPEFDSGWAPPTPPDEKFYLDVASSQIVDIKETSVIGWEQIPVGDVFDEITQSVRIRFMTCGTSTVDVDLDTVVLQRVKSGPNTYRFREKPE